MNALTSEIVLRVLTTLVACIIGGFIAIVIVEIYDRLKRKKK